MWRILFVVFLSVLEPGLARADRVSGYAAFSAGDFAAAYRAWSEAALAGDASSMAALGTLYDTGHGVPQDFTVALQWYRRSAEAGDVRGMFNTGAMYDNGRGTAADRAAALYWYRLAADRGYGRAAYAAGLILRDGDGVPRDRTNSVRYFRIATRAGIVAARASLAALNVAETPPPAPSGKGIVQQATTTLNSDQRANASLQKAILTRDTLDEPTARRLSKLMPVLESQAGRNSRIAQYDVGFAFENGYGMARDPVKSYVYYLRATASTENDVKAAALRGAADVAKILTMAQHAKARDMLLDDTP